MIRVGLLSSGALQGRCLDRLGSRTSRQPRNFHSLPRIGETETGRAVLEHQTSGDGKDRPARDATLRRMKRGRKKGSGVLSGIQPQRETWDDIRNRIIYGTAEWRIVRLHQLVLTLKKEQATAQRGVRPK